MHSQFKCYEHIKEIIGIKTNVAGFRWGFGKCDIPVSDEKYENCKIRVLLEERKDADVFKDLSLQCYTECFRHFKVDTKSHSMIFEKRIGKLINLKFFMTINGNTVKLIVGKSYLKYIKAKMMYIHSVAYILFDAVSLLLLKNNMTALYCSAAHLNNENNVVFLAPPNTGKSLTVLKLKNDYNAEIIAEDMAVTDGKRIWGAPHTNLYRKYNDKSLAKSIETDDKNDGYSIGTVAVLQKSATESTEQVTDCLKEALLINRYSLGYYYSPVIRVFDYYYDDFSVKTAEITEESLLKMILSNSDTFRIKSSNSMNYSKLLISLLKNGGMNENSCFIPKRLG